MLDGLFVCTTLKQVAEGGVPLLCEQERKRTPVRKRLSRTQAVLGRAIPEGWLLVLGMKMRSFVVFSNYSVIVPSVIRPERRTSVVVR